MKGCPDDTPVLSSYFGTVPELSISFGGQRSYQAS